MGLLDALDELLSDDEEFDPDFRIVNDTGYEIYELYVSESVSDTWDEDVLDDDTLDDGESMMVRFSTTSRHRWWDIKIVDEEGDEAVFDHIDLSRVSRVELYYDDEGDPCVRCS